MCPLWSNKELHNEGVEDKKLHDTYHVIGSGSHKRREGKCSLIQTVLYCNVEVTSFDTSDGRDFIPKRGQASEAVTRGLLTK